MNIWNNNKKDKHLLPHKSDNVALNKEEDIYQVEPNETIFLETLIAQKKEVQVFLMGGIKLTGILTGMDDYVIMMTTRRYAYQLVYKHSISTISISDNDNEYKNY